MVKLNNSIKELEQRIQDAQERHDFTRFDEMPLSSETLAGLKKSSFAVMTEIQSSTLMRSLKGLDILGAAKTGSGKTCGYLLPGMA